MLLLLALVVGLALGATPLLKKGEQAWTKVAGWFSSPEPPPPEEVVPVSWPLEQARILVQDLPFLNAEESEFTIQSQDQIFQVQTSLDPELMARLNATMANLKSRKRGKPRQLAFAAVNGRTGQIVAMSGYDLETPNVNPVARDVYPAASLFKIVTATAVIDDLGYTPGTPLYFNGNKYTLYKRQLKETRNKYTSRTTLARAFAESINPVFGKLGQNRLGRERLDQYAAAFGFSAPLPGDLTLQSGQFATNESKYHLAELGCGFNQQTRISPIFAAVMVTSVLNQGRSLVPTMVDSISATDEIIYKREKAFYKTAMKPETADAMMKLMQKTISSGTARKSFRRTSRDKVLSKLIIGGKTGSLYNREHTIKYDWFTGFGKTRSGDDSLAVAVLVGHGKYIGVRAATHARSILRTYFAPRLTPAADSTSSKN